MNHVAHIPLNRADRAALEHAARLLRERFPVCRLALFGSKARGDADDESDVDLLILTARRLSQNEKDDLIDALLDIQLEKGVILSPLIIAKEDWEGRYWNLMPIHAEIEREGVDL